MNLLLWRPLRVRVCSVSQFSESGGVLEMGRSVLSSKRKDKGSGVPPPSKLVQALKHTKTMSLPSKRLGTASGVSPGFHSGIPRIVLIVAQAIPISQKLFNCFYSISLPLK